MAAPPTSPTASAAPSTTAATLGTVASLIAAHHPRRRAPPRPRRTAPRPHLPLRRRTPRPLRPRLLVALDPPQSPSAWPSPKASPISTSNPTAPPRKMTMRFDILTIFRSFSPARSTTASSAGPSPRRGPRRHPRPARLRPRPPSHRGRPSLRRRRRNGPQAPAHLRLHRVAIFFGQFILFNVYRDVNNNHMDTNKIKSNGLLIRSPHP